MNESTSIKTNRTIQEMHPQLERQIEGERELVSERGRKRVRGIENKRSSPHAEL